MLLCLMSPRPFRFAVSGGADGGKVQGEGCGGCTFSPFRCGGCIFSPFHPFTLSPFNGRGLLLLCGADVAHGEGMFLFILFAHNAAICHLNADGALGLAAKGNCAGVEQEAFGV